VGVTFTYVPRDNSAPRITSEHQNAIIACKVSHRVRRALEDMATDRGVNMSAVIREILQRETATQ
jgi:post-segregation antitoxin (ccd killing protein)